jgi:chromosomal replication initiation ATPase DnaA
MNEVIHLTNVSKTFQHKTAVKDLWSLVLKKIRDKISKPSFETWLANTNAKIEDDGMIVSDSNSFVADWLDADIKVSFLKLLRKWLEKSMKAKSVLLNSQFMTKRYNYEY